MPVVVRTDNAIDINTIADQIDEVVIQFFDNFNINIYDLSQRKMITHNLLNLCFREIYKQLFKPSKGMINNQSSILDYNDTELLQVLADKFLDICQMFNKSLGLMSFSFMTGINSDTLRRWCNEDRKLNSKRYEIIKGIQEGHKQAQIGLLNDTPVGALAVANNDIETGLNWSQNQVAAITNNNVYYLPSERLDKLKLDKQD